MTLLAIVSALILLYFCGFGPTLLLINPKESPYRVVVMPALGLCCHIVFSIFLAQFSLNGSTISAIVLPFFACLAVMGWRRSGLSRQEWRRAAPALLLGLFAAALVGWPLVRNGVGNYWGLANPDQAFLTPVLEWIQGHPLGIPPEYRDKFHYLGGFRDIPQNTLLAIFYFTSTVSLITAVPIGLLFNVTGLCMVYLTPCSVYVLCDELGLPRGTCISATGAVACSALAAYTFYLDSLAAMTLIAVLPLCVALALRLLKKPGYLTASPLVIAYESCRWIWFSRSHCV